jgi:glycine cleavage system regulatory protein
MQIDAKTVAELWETIKDYVNANKREELITAILQLLVDNDVEIEDLEELKDVDDDLDSALEEVFDDFDLDDDF